VTNPFYTRLSRLDQQRLVEALKLAETSSRVSEAKASEYIELWKKLENLRDRTQGTVGSYEFRGLFCRSCEAQTPHCRKYKSDERFVCDECGETN